MSPNSFDDTFETLKHRVLAIGGASGATWGCSAAIGLLLAGMWLDLVWDLSAAARLIAVLAAVIAGLTLLASFVARAIRRAQDAVLARQLDETGETGGEIVSGFELQTASSSTTTMVGLTHALAELAVVKAARRAAQIPLALVAPSQPVRRAAVSFGALSLGLILIAMLAPRLAGTEWLRFADPFGDHPPFSQTELRVEPGDAKVRYGDGLDVFVTTAGPPVDELELVLRIGNSKTKLREEALPMFPDSPGRRRASVAAVTTPGQYFVRARTTRSHRFQLNVITVPQLEEVRFRVTPPAYTRDAPYEGPLPQGGLSALAGATVEVRARSNRPLSSGALEIVSGEQHETVKLEPVSADGDSHEVLGSWTIARPGTFQLKVTDVAGQDSRDSFTGTINVLKDQVPFVRLLEPAPQSLATPSITLPVVIAAEDDYGITKLQLFRSLNDSQALPLSLPTTSPPSRRHEEQTPLPLSAYGLRPGDVIKLFARVEDNDPAGAKGSESPVAVIQIVSDEDLQQMVRTREGVDVLLSKYQQAQRRLEALQEEIEQLKKQLEKRDADGALSDEEKQSLEKLAERIAEEAEAVRESAKHTLPYDIDKALNKELEKLAEQMEQAAEETKQAASQPGGKPSAGKAAKKLDEVQKKLAQERKEFKEGVNDPLDQLAQIYPLLEDQSRFVELYHRQRDLAERLASLKDRDNPEDPATKARMRELEDEQRKNREDLDALLNDIEEHASRLPDDDPKLKELAESAREFVEAVRGSGANQAMSDAESGLAEFSGTRGHGEAKHAADILEKFLSRCQGMGEQSEGACNSLKFKPGEGCLGDTLSQMLADAGFKPGGGKPGQNGALGAGGGFSARRSSLSNIGLYGNLPTRGNPTQSKSGGGKQSLSVGGSYRTDADRVTSSRLDPHGLLKASGAGETAVPARYRSRVEQYFQRIADEASK
ncbi:MAG: hypothetical protein IAG10_00455 [Planctomycetaceae bacterium]|nr:hypothetical protein [Planctomycetaceae bacterium]